MARVLMPLPSMDFDPTEAAIPWRMLKSFGHEVWFATPDGKPAAADPCMVTGEGLDFWGWVPGLRKLVLGGRMLRANLAAREAYAAMIKDARYLAPMGWDQAKAEEFRGIVFPGGHRARGMRAYLESKILQDLAVAAFRADVPVAAICHGVLLLARSVDPESGKSVLYGRRTTALTWQLEKSGWLAGKILRFWDPSYYRTYMEKPGEQVGYMSVQQEVMRALAKPVDFCEVSNSDHHFAKKTSGLDRDSEGDASPGFVVVDGKYVSARWPGDAHGFARAFDAVLREEARA
jgi:putative intracellular protease/amidase